MHCKYCGKEYFTNNALKNHELRCKKNSHKLNYKMNNQFTKAKENGIQLHISDDVKSKISKSLKDFYSIDENRLKNKLAQEKRFIDDPDERKRISNYMKIAVENHPESYCGVNKNGRVKKYKFKDVSLDGSWELLVAKYLDENNINWIRPNKGISYIWNDSQHKYFPDFYLVDFDFYLEIKGYETNRDKEKYKVVKNLFVFRKKEIKQILNKEFNLFDILRGDSSGS